VKNIRAHFYRFFLLEISKTVLTNNSSKSYYFQPMEDQSTIFVAINEEAKRRRNLKRKVRVGQVAAMTSSLFLILFTVSLFANQGTVTFVAYLICSCFLIISLLSFKWPSVFLLLYSLVFSLSLLLFIIVQLLSITHPAGEKAIVGVIVINVVFALLDSLVIYGTFAAKKLKKISRV